MPPPDNNKRTVVILAEDPKEGKRGEDNKESTFINQAKWWKKQHPEYNVIVKPFYKGWEGNDMSDIVSQLQEIEGVFDIAFMGHSGKTMGGIPLSDQASKRITIDRANWTLRKGHNELRDSIVSVLGDREAGAKPSPRTLEDFIDIEGLEKADATKIEKLAEGFAEQKTIADYINIDLEGKVENIIIGGCGQGRTHGNAMQSMASETNKNVFCQYKGAWGTGAIKETGETPQEKFFVSGKDTKVGGVLFSPHNPPQMIEARKQKDGEPFVYSSEWTDDTYGALEGLIKDDDDKEIGAMALFDSGYEDWTPEDIKEEQALIDLGDPSATTRSLKFYTKDQKADLGDLLSSEYNSKRNRHLYENVYTEDDYNIDPHELRPKLATGEVIHDSQDAYSKFLKGLALKLNAQDDEMPQGEQQPLYEDFR